MNWKSLFKTGGTRKNKKARSRKSRRGGGFTRR
jgi:hypothetical protein